MCRRVISHVFCGEMCDVKDGTVVLLHCPVTSETRDVYHSSPQGGGEFKTTVSLCA